MSAGIFADEAPRYWAKGLSVVPVRPGTKQPSINKWSSFAANLPKEARRNEWIADFGSHGIGLLLGTNICSGFSIGAVDVDDDRLVGPAREVLGTCLYAKKGKKGQTIFVRVPDEPKLKSTTLKGANGLGNIDILAGGRMTVLPPTPHPDTNAPYEWQGDELLDCELSALPILDQNKLTVMKRAIASEHAAALISGQATHDPGVAFTAELLAAGASDEEIHAVIRGLLPPGYSGNSLEEIQGWIDSGREKGFDTAGQEDLPRDEQVARIIEADFVSLVYVEGEGFLHYADGHWRHVSYGDINRRAKGTLLRFPTKGLVSSLLKPVLRCLSLNVEKPGFGDHSGRICLLNGTLNVATGELEKHSPDHQLRYRLDIEYDPQATCPTYDEQIRQTLKGDEKAISLFDEFAALTLVPDMRYQKALYLIGPGGSGKSTLLKVIEMMHDPDAVTTTSLTKIEDERHRTELARKLVCITFDVQTNRKVFGETFSRITGGDPITTRRLYEEVQGNVTPTVRFVGSMNPDTPEYIASPDALERRLIFLPCGAKITDPDPDRFAKLKAERPGILVRWQHALQRLYQRGHFDIPDAAKAEVEEYIHNQEAFDLFAAERLVADANAATPVAEITRDFNYWVDQAGATHLSPQVVGRKLRRLGFQCVSQRVERDGRSINTRVVRARIRTNRKLSEEF